MRALLYREPGPESAAAGGVTPSADQPAGSVTAEGRLVDKTGPFPWPNKLMPLITRVERDPVETSAKITWTSNPASAEDFYVIPLTGRNKNVLGMFLVGSSIRERVELEKHIRVVASAGGRSRNAAGRGAERVDGGARHPAGGAVGGSFAASGGGKLERARGNALQG